VQDFLVVAVLTAVLLNFKPSRKAGLVLLALLYVGFPNQTITTLLLGGGVYLYWRSK